MLGKLLMLILVVAFIYLFIIPSFRKSSKNDDKKEVQNFIECDKCGTYIDIKEATLSGGKYICNDCLRK